MVHGRFVGFTWYLYSECSHCMWGYGGTGFLWRGLRFRFHRCAAFPKGDDECPQVFVRRTAPSDVLIVWVVVGAFGGLCAWLFTGVVL